MIVTLRFALVFDCLKIPLLCPPLVLDMLFLNNGRCSFHPFPFSFVFIIEISCHPSLAFPYIVSTGNQIYFYL